MKNQLNQNQFKNHTASRAVNRELHAMSRQQAARTNIIKRKSKSMDARTVVLVAVLVSFAAVVAYNILTLGIN